nr:hypothetical protein [Nannocystis pusilla]
MQVEIELVDEHDPGRLFGRVLAVVGIEPRRPPCDVASEGQQVTVTVREDAERQGAAILEVDPQLFVIDGVIKTLRALHTIDDRIRHDLEQRLPNRSHR